MRIVAHLVTHNEADRYLAACLDSIRSYADAIVVFDDRSTDDTPAICATAGAHVVTRPDDVPTFLEHEGRFRAAAWRTLADHAEPGDWVLAIDADEFLVPFTGGHLAELIRYEIAGAHSLIDGLAVHKHEIFDPGPPPLVRLDGWWGQITAVRFARWDGRSEFINQRFACGAVPLTVQSTIVVQNFSMLHYGYARQEDRVERHARYTGTPGHDRSHIDSIITTPRGRQWDGVHPNV